MPPGITIVGLGPGPSDDWTRAAFNRLHQAEEVVLRTARHPSAADIPAKTITFDTWYEQSDDMDQIHDRMAAEVIRLGGREEGVVYAVPGHPGIDEPTVPRIQALALDRGLPVRIIPGLSLLEAVFTALKVRALPELQLADAALIAGRHHPPLGPDRPALVLWLKNSRLAGQVKAVLLNAYAETLVVTLVQDPGAETERVWLCRLAELDKQAGLNVATALYLPPDPAHTSLATFQETIAHLRAPEGCPWDREQTHQSLRPFLLEETYEVLETLDSGDVVALAEELGDLLLQIALHAQIATQSGEFKMGEIIGQINRKLLRRHPHVFGQTVVNGIKDVMTNWEAIKKMEKANSRPEAAVHSALDGIPPELPALAQAMVISKKAVRVGFEWPNIEGVLDKLVEEAREITQATNPTHLEAEIGDLLFSAVNLARWRSIDAESALRGTNARFTRRFKKLEALAVARGQNLPEMSIEEMDVLWNEAKQLVG